MTENENVFILSEEIKNKIDYSKLQCKIKINGLPRNVVSYSIDSYVGFSGVDIKCKKYAEKFSEFLNHNTSLYLWSKQNCTQKTTLAAWVAKEILLQGFQVFFITLGDLLVLLSKLDKSPEDLFKLSYIDESSLLVIDDSFDSRKCVVYRSGFQIPFLDSFLRSRMEIQRKPVIFTSNIDPHEIDTSIFGQSLVSLVQRNIYDIECSDSININKKFEISKLFD
jgi:DNA replication protein DnaC